jgi:hypothetical protein
MIVKIVKKYYALKRAIVVSFAPTELCPVHLFNRIKVVAINELYR